jgi:hypothetical protein
MSKQKIAYWVVTALVALSMTMSAGMYLTAQPQALEGFRHLGYPEYFRLILGVAKLLGAVALLAPVPRTLKEWAYAGFAFNMIAAAASHAGVGDGAGQIVSPLIALGLVLTSHQLWRRVSAGSTQAEPAVRVAGA